MRPVRRQRVPVPLVGPAGGVRSKDVSDQDTVNLYPEINPNNTEELSLVSCSGFEQLTALTGNGHGLAVRDGQLYAFVGEDVYEVTSGGGASSIGTIPSMGRIRAASNGDQLAVIPRNVSSGYVVESGSVTEITDANLLAVSDVAFLNQRIVWLNQDSGRIQWSDLLDAFTYDALNFSTAEGQPDDATAVMSDARQLFVGGERTIETFYNTAEGDFIRTPQGVATKGVASRDTMILFDNAPTFLGLTQNGGFAVYRLVDGFNVQRISTNAVDIAIGSYNDPDKAFAFSYFEDGHDYYVLTFPGQATWVYDAATQLWHRRKSYGREDWGVVDVQQIYGKLLGLLHDGDIVEIKSSLFQESGDVTERLRVTPPLNINGNRFTVHRLELECETGHMDSTTPLVMEMSLSRDRGRTYGPWKPGSIGRQGDYQKRVFWNQLGSFRDVVVRFRQTDNAAATWISAWADVEVMQS